MISCLTVIPVTVWILKGVAAWQNVHATIYDQVTLLVTPIMFIGNMAHLWFLWYLLIIAFIFIGLVKVGVKFQIRFWWLLIPASFVAKLFMKEPLVFGADTVAAMIPELPVLLCYLYLPFVVAQTVVVNLPISHHIKYVLVLAVVSVIGLATYAFGARIHVHWSNFQRSTYETNVIDIEFLITTTLFCRRLSRSETFHHPPERHHPKKQQHGWLTVVWYSYFAKSFIQ